MNYKGTIIKESLENEDILKDVKILGTEIEKVVEEHKTPWLKQWTLYSVEIPEKRAKEIVEKISKLGYSIKLPPLVPYKYENTIFLLFLLWQTFLENPSQ